MRLRRCPSLPGSASSRNASIASPGVLQRPRGRLERVAAARKREPDPVAVADELVCGLDEVRPLDDEARVLVRPDELAHLRERVRHAVTEVPTLPSDASRLGGGGAHVLDVDELLYETTKSKIASTNGSDAASPTTNSGRWSASAAAATSGGAMSRATTV